MWKCEDVGIWRCCGGATECCLRIRNGAPATPEREDYFPCLVKAMVRPRYPCTCPHQCSSGCGR